MPMSYILTGLDYEAFQRERERDKEALYILKPVAASCGRGIKIISHSQKVNQKEGILASKYLDEPHLIKGLKYDLRIYVLVTNFNPLKVYIYDDGLVRFATEKYTKDVKTLNKKFVHLTNFSINKRAPNFVKNDDPKKP
jgi:tubulin polyglutamylase TTLL4